MVQGLWIAATAQPISYRFQKSLLEVRNALIKQGVADQGQIPIPAWMAERAAEIGVAYSPNDQAQKTAIEVTQTDASSNEVETPSDGVSP